MKILICFAILSATIIACNNSQQSSQSTSSNKPDIQGTWKLIEGITIEKNDSTITDYTKDKSFIKVINATHFSFMGHDVNKGKDSATAYYSSGGGRYDLNDSNYTEHLEYCNAREWEGNDFHLTVYIHNDTLISQGIEKVDSIGVNRINIEKYVRLK
jgi:hypothetical protein